MAPAGHEAAPLSWSELADRIAGLGNVREVHRLLRQQGARVLHPEAVDKLSDEMLRFVNSSLEKARRLSEAVRWIADRLDDDHSKARALRTAAHLLFYEEKYDQAIERYDSALREFRSLGREIEVGRTLSSSLTPLTYLGRYGEAEVRAQEARSIFERAGDRLRLARLDSNLANVLFRQDRFPEALQLYQRALETFRAEGKPNDLAVVLRNLAACRINLNQFAQALETYREAQGYCERHGLTLLAVENDYNIAYLHYLRGEYTRAIELYRTARKGSEAAGDAYHQALCDLDQAELYLELNLIAEGVELAERAFAGFEALGMGYERAKALTNMAVGAGRRGEALRALELFAQARQGFVHEGNRVWPALIDAYRAVVLDEEGRHFEARRLVEEAALFFSEAGLTSKAAFCDLVLARVLLHLGELILARERCQRALERLGDAPAMAYHAQFLLGQVHEGLDQEEEAVAAYRTAHGLAERLRSRIREDDLKIGFLKDKVGVYESLVWMALGDRGSAAGIEQAIGYIEQAKSRSLAELVAFRAGELPGRTETRGGLVQQVHGLRQELNWYYQRIDLAEISQGRRTAETEVLRRLTREREVQLLRALREVAPRDEDFALMQRGGAVGIEAIRGSLPPTSLMVEYYQARGAILAALIGRDRLEIVPLCAASRARHHLQLLRFQLSKFQLGADYVQRFDRRLKEATDAHLEELYDDLIAPLRSRLDAEHLIVVPHDFLHYVPFHALADRGAALIDDFSVSYAPSGSVHHLCRAKPAAREESLVLGVVDPATPHVLEEVEAVAQALPGARLFIAEAADEQALREYGPTSRFIHIATHGSFRYDNPMFSSVRLGTSHLSVFDLYGLDLSAAELVVLSGCGTGLSVMQDGDELLGLVRGLLYAGAQAALVALWDVNDHTTARLMRDFHHRHLGTANKAAALRQSMLALREEFPHAYYWAPFVLVGRAAAS
jgi:CHAT domain-containing protein